MFPEAQASSEGQLSCVDTRGISSCSPSALCPGDEELVREVLFDAVVTAPMEAYWTALALNVSEYVPGAEGSQEGKRFWPWHSLG